MQGFNTLCFSSPCLWEPTDGLNIKARCQWVKTRLCFVSDLQASIMSGKEMDCSGLWLDYDYFFKASLLWADRRVALQQGEGLRVTESPMLSGGWKKINTGTWGYRMCVMNTAEPQSSGDIPANMRTGKKHNLTFFLKKKQKTKTTFSNVSKFSFNQHRASSNKLHSQDLRQMWQITAAWGSDPLCNLQFTHWGPAL